ncbi:MAG: hypothetical protein K2M12_07375 [Muribaculaceae bacterium]|nr:hypothetical protein [Muribaculaceae bacterium]
MMIPGRQWWQRLRHSRGFGVHSPFAYRFIREVLRGPYAFYAYADLPGASSGWPGGCDAARVLFRIAVWAWPASVAVCGEGREAAAARRIVGLACPHAEIDVDAGEGCGLAVVCPDAAQEQLEGVFRAASAGTAAVYIADRHAPQCAALLHRLGVLDYGHTYVNGSGVAIFVGRRALPAQTFRVRF